MRRTHVVQLFLLLFLCLALAGMAQAETKFENGLTERVRYEYWENAFDLDTNGVNNESFFRFKTTIFEKMTVDNFGLFVMLGNEARYYMQSSTRTPSTTSKLNSGFEADELYFDNLYADFKSSAVDIRVGRQDLVGQYGENFLVMDGTPGDGSRTFFFNAARVITKFAENQSLDLVYLANTAYDTYLPVLHSGTKRLLNASDEQGALAYGKFKLGNFGIEPYYIWKQEGPINNPATGAVINSRTLKLSTYGGRVVMAADAWKVRAEYAQQSGSYDNNGPDRSGKGGYLFVGRSTEPFAFDLGYVYLSGDDPSTANKNEAWDPLFSRYPAWSELYVFTLTNENRAVGGFVPAYWSNIQIYRAMAKFGISKEASASLWYNYLLANENPASSRPTATSAPLFSLDGKVRGHLPQAQFSYKIAKNIDSYVLVEYFNPGSFYVDQAKDAWFTRVQLQIKL